MPGANGRPSVRIQPPLPMRALASTPVVEIHAWYVPGSPAAAARLAHSVSAPATPPSRPGTGVVDVTNMYDGGPKAAVTATSLASGMKQVGLVPLHSPPPAANCDPGPTFAVSVMPALALCVMGPHELLQLTLPSSEVMTPVC